MYGDGSTPLTTSKQQGRCSNPAASGDAIFVVGQYGAGSNSISSVADYPSGSDLTWVTDKQVFDSSNGQTVAYMVRLNNATAGAGVRGDGHV